MRAALRFISSVLIVAGVLMLADAGITLLWQEPVSAVVAKLGQDALADDLDALARTAPSPADHAALARVHASGRRMAVLARRLDRSTGEGRPLARIRIPRIGLSAVVVQGTDAPALRKGPGHYPATPLPGQPGTVAIAGHRTTYGAPFSDVDRLRRGDEIELELPYGRFRYRVEGSRIVAPSATWVTRRVGHDRLVLTACHPRYSAAKRIVVFARRVAAEPRGLARAQ
jgi:sortase A